MFSVPPLVGVVLAHGYDTGMLEDELNVGYDDPVMYNGNDYTMQPGYGPGYVSKYGLCCM